MRIEKTKAWEGLYHNSLCRFIRNFQDIYRLEVIFEKSPFYSNEDSFLLST